MFIKYSAIETSPAGRVADHAFICGCVLRTRKQNGLESVSDLLNKQPTYHFYYQSFIVNVSITIALRNLRFVIITIRIRGIFFQTYYTYYYIILFRLSKQYNII